MRRLSRERKYMKTSIVILTHNQLNFTKQCIDSIRKYTAYGTYELIIVDNASSDGSVEWLQQQPDLRVLYNSQNEGFPRGCNQGIGIALFDNILLLNNDTIVTPNWLANLTTCLHSDAAIGAVSAVTNNCSYYQTIATNYQSEAELYSFAQEFNVSNPGLWEDRIKLVGYCFLMKRTVLQKTGLLDERFSPGNFEDDDLSFRILEAGYRLVLCKDTFIHHYGSVSFKEKPEWYRQLMATNKQKFIEKWGIDPAYSLNIRHDLVNLLELSAQKPLHILEVGCACGATLLKIKSINKNVNLYGIEHNSHAAGIAGLFAEVTADNIEEANLSFTEEMFDYIIFGDVLEHLYNPLQVLRNMHKYLKADGKIVASIPNVMHFSVVRNLLAGHWSYEEAGILDRTHIRFFTLNEINKLFAEAGYTNMRYRYTSISAQQTEQDTEFIKAIAAIAGEGLERQFEAYQYLVIADKPHSSNKIVTENTPITKNLGEIHIKKWQQQKIFELLQTVHEVNAEIEQLALPDKADAVINLLADCQDFMVQIGSFIDVAAGEGTHTVTLLGEYLKLLYEASLAVNNEDEKNNFLKLLCKQLNKIEHSVRTELKPDKVEILFLPYKVSMWDSLESIWLAAREDKEHCNVTVMPIPYCDRKPDGTIIEWHYEAKHFPGYVPVVDYRKYDIAKRRPDIIYIHNPNDGTNSVTSVEPQYYSQELKKHTAMLVYVPYFISGKEWPELHVQVSCYQYMDKMIVPQDNLRIRTQEGNLSDTCLHDCLPAQKLVPLGSPKTDRIFYCEKNKTIPPKWKKIIRGKKVVLYNVSLSSIFRFGRLALAKMKCIFDCFARRQDIVLLWRPHPLIHASLQSMLPDLYGEYKKLEKEFIKKQIGILDETPDINMAVAIADAYLGEASSSVIHLFGIVGKPVFFTDTMISWDKPTPEEQASVRFGYTLVEDDEVWFMAEGYNALCRMNLSSGQITPIVKFADFPVLGGLYSQFLKIDNTILLAPGNAKEICEYSLETGECKKIPLENPLEYGNFGQIVRYKQYVFLLPWRYPAIVRMNLETGECKYYTECLEELLAGRTPKHDELLGGYCQREQKLVIPSVQTNKILEFDMETGEYQLYTAGQEPGYACIIENGDDYWLIPRTTRTIVKWNYQTGKWQGYDDYPQEFNCASDWHTGDTYMFSGALKLNGAIWLFPRYANMVLHLDLSAERIQPVELKLPYGLYDRKSAFYLQQANFLNAFACGDSTIAALSAYDRSLLIVDTKSGTARLQPCRLSTDDVAALSTPLAQSFGPISPSAPYVSAENGLWSNIESYIDYVIADCHDQQAQREAYAGFINNADGSCGKKVHQYIMEQVCDASD